MIEEILSKVLKFEGVREVQKFATQFKNLYGIGVYKDGLDLILTRAKQDKIIFEVKIIKGWDTNLGCYTTDQEKVYNKLLKTFTFKKRHKITIRDFQISTLAHEMGHLLEVESGLVLNEDFRKAIGIDINGRKPDNLALAGDVERIMMKALESYTKDHVMAELFARYFELLSLSRAINHNGSYSEFQVTDFFINTTNWIKSAFNPRIKAKIDPKIAAYTADLIAAKENETEKKFADNSTSFFKRVDDSGAKSWSGNVHSNSAWQQSWQKHQEIEDKKPNN